MTFRSRRILPIILLFALATGAPALAQTADFDWKMPPRTGLDDDKDGIFDSLTTREQIDPATFTVNFNACNSFPPLGKTIALYRWTIEGWGVGFSGTCEIQWELAQSVYTVTLEIVVDDGSTASITKQVTVRDWLIVAVGDSYGSGEGNPEIDADWSDVLNPGPAQWQNNGCKRSHFSGQALAAQMLEDADERTSVTFVHLSCTGATIVGVTDGQISRVAPDDELNTDALIGDREIDALLLTVGGNNVGFSDIIMKCMRMEPCFEADAEDQVATLIGACALMPVVGGACLVALAAIEKPAEGESAATIFENGLNKFKGLIEPEYGNNVGNLHHWIVNELKGPKDDPGRVYWTEYPNMTEDEKGDLCAFDLDVEKMLPLISHRETEWFRGLTQQLNKEIEDWSLGYGWTYVGGIYDAFHTHGYCALEHWVHRIQDSLISQLDYNGTAHPNKAGHGIYRDKIWDHLKSDLYPDGLPRAMTESVQPSVSAVLEREPDHDGWYTADVTIRWKATDPFPSSGIRSFADDTIVSTEGFEVRYVSGPSCDAAKNCGRGEVLLSLDKTPPVVTVTVPAVVEATSDDGAKVAFTTTGMDNVIGALTPDCVLDGGPSVASGDTLALGGHQITCRATDAAGNTGTASAPVSVGDTTAPEIRSLSLPNDGVMWPSNGRMVPMTVTASVFDAVSTPSCSITAVRSNEPSAAGDWRITGPLSVELRASRAGGGSGRVYTITVSCADSAGNASTSQVAATVPHDQRPNAS